MAKKSKKPTYKVSPYTEKIKEEAKKNRPKTQIQYGKKKYAEDVGTSLYAGLMENLKAKRTGTVNGRQGGLDTKEGSRQRQMTVEQKRAEEEAKRTVRGETTMPSTLDPNRTQRAKFRPDDYKPVSMTGKEEETGGRDLTSKKTGKAIKLAGKYAGQAAGEMSMAEKRDRLNSFVSGSAAKFKSGADRYSAGLERNKGTEKRPYSAEYGDSAREDKLKDLVSGNTTTGKAGIRSLVSGKQKTEGIGPKSLSGEWKTTGNKLKAAAEEEKKPEQLDEGLAPAGTAEKGRSEKRTNLTRFLQESKAKFYDYKQDEGTQKRPEETQGAAMKKAEPGTEQTKLEGTPEMQATGKKPEKLISTPEETAAAMKAQKPGGEQAQLEGLPGMQKAGSQPENLVRTPEEAAAAQGPQMQLGGGRKAGTPENLSGAGAEVRSLTGNPGQGVLRGMSRNISTAENTLENTVETAEQFKRAGDLLRSINQKTVNLGTGKLDYGSSHSLADGEAGEATSYENLHGNNALIINGVKAGLYDQTDDVRLHSDDQLQQDILMWQTIENSLMKQMDQILPKVNESQNLKYDSVVSLWDEDDEYGTSRMQAENAAYSMLEFPQDYLTGDKEHDRIAAYDAINGEGAYDRKIASLNETEKAALDGRIDAAIEPYQLKNDYGTQMKNLQDQIRYCQDQRGAAEREVAARSEHGKVVQEWKDKAESDGTYDGSYHPENDTYSDRFFTPYSLSTQSNADFIYSWINRGNAYKGQNDLFQNHVSEMEGDMVYKHADLMTPEEREIFNDFYNAGQKEEALAFVDGLADTLAKRNRYFLDIAQKQYANVDPVGSSLVTFAMTARQPAEFLQGLYGDLTGKPVSQDDRYMTMFKDNIRQTIGQNILNATDSQLLYTIYNSGMSAGDCTVNLFLMKGIGGAGISDTMMKYGTLALFATEAYESSYVRYMDETNGDYSTSVAMATVDALIETSTEILSVEALLSNPTNLFKYIGKCCFSEGMEEVTGSAFGPLIQKCINGRDEWTTRANVILYRDKGYYKDGEFIPVDNYEDALRQAMREWKDEIIWSGIGGAMSPMLGGGTFGAYRHFSNAYNVGENYLSNQQNAQQNGQQSGTQNGQQEQARNGLAELVQQASESENKDVRKMAKAFQRKLQRGGHLTTTETGMVVMNAVTESNAAVQEASDNAMREAVGQILQIEDEDERQHVAGVVTEAYQRGLQFVRQAVDGYLQQGGSEELNMEQTLEEAKERALDSMSAEDRYDLTHSRSAMEAFNQLMDNQDNETKTTVNQAVADATVEARTKRAELVQMAQVNREQVEQARKALERREINPNSSLSHVATEEEINQAEGERQEGSMEAVADGRLTQVLGIRDGKVIVRGEDGNEQALEAELVHPTNLPAAAIIHENAVNRGHLSDALANTLLQNIDNNGTENVAHYIEDALDMRFNARMRLGMPETRMNRETAERIWQACLDEAGNQRIKEFENAEKSLGVGNGTATFKGVQFGTEAWDNLMKDPSLHLTQGTREQIEYAARLAKVSGMQLNLKTTEEFKEDEKLIHGSQKGNTVTLNVNFAEQNIFGQAVGTRNLLVTFGHEFTHWLKGNSMAGYNSMEQFVISRIMKSGQSLRMMLDERMQRYEQQGVHLDMFDAVDELVADACDQVLGSSQFMNYMKKNEQGLFKNVQGFVQHLVDKVKSAFSGHSLSMSRAALSMAGYANDLHRLWTGAYDEAITHQLSDAMIRNAEGNKQDKFSLAAPVEGRKDGLIATHNLTVENWIRMLKFNGIAMPSIAVMNESKVWNAFNGVSLYFGEDVVNPAFTGNRLYSGDAWTARFEGETVANTQEALQLLRSKRERVPEHARDIFGTLTNYKKVNSLDEARRMASRTQGETDTSAQVFMAKDEESRTRERAVWKTFMQDVKKQERFAFQQDYERPVLNAVLEAVEKIESSGENMPEQQRQILRAALEGQLQQAKDGKLNLDAEVVEDLQSDNIDASQLSDETIDAILDFANYVNSSVMRDMQEAKPDYIVGLNQIKCIVLPQNAGDEVMQLMKAAGINEGIIKFYNPNAAAEDADSRKNVQLTVPQTVPETRFSVADQARVNEALRQDYSKTGLQKDTSRILEQAGFLTDQAPARYSFAGETTVYKKDIDKARQMAKEGYSDADITKATGCVKGFRGNWWKVLENGSVNEKFTENPESYSGKRVRLDEVFDSPEQFEAYPQLKDVEVYFDPNMDMGKLGEAAEDITGEGYMIWINAAIADFTDLVNQTLRHEAQHITQFIEGTHNGANPGFWANMKRAAERMLNNDAHYIESTFRMFGINVQEELQTGVVFNEDGTINTDLLTPAEKEKVEKIPAEQVAYMKNLMEDALKWSQLEGMDAKTLYENTVGEIEARTASRIFEEQLEGFDYTNAVAAEDFTGQQVKEAAGTRYSFAETEGTLDGETQKLNNEYKQAIKNADWATARLLINRQARKKGWTPVMLYHQTGEQFTEFNTDNPVAGATDSETPNGIFLKTNDHDIGVGGDYVNTGHGGNVQMQLYIKAQNLLHFANRKEAKAWYEKNVPGYREKVQAWDKLYQDKYQGKFDAIDKEMFDPATTDERYQELEEYEDKLTKELGEEERAHFKAMRELLNQYFLENDSGYDGIELDYDGHRYIDGKREDVHTFIVFDPHQVKSADNVTYDNKGKVIPLNQRFDETKSDIRWSLGNNGNQMDTGTLQSLGLSREYAFLESDEVIRKADAILEQRKQEVADLIKGEDFMAMQLDNGLQKLILTRSNREGVQYQLTYMGNDDMPNMHESYGTIGQGNSTENIHEMDELYQKIADMTMDRDIMYAMTKEDIRYDQLSKPDENGTRVLESDHPGEDPIISVTDSGTVERYSIMSWVKEDQRGKVIRFLQKQGHTEEEINKWIQQLDDVASMIMKDPDRLDYKPDRSKGAKFKKPNGDVYKWTLDASTLCAKRRLYQGTFNAIQKLLPNTALRPGDLIELANMMHRMGKETPCGICYVESRRRHAGNAAQQWLDKYEGAYTPTIRELTTTDGLAELKEKHPETYRDFVRAMNLRGAGSIKMVQQSTDYRSDLRRMSRSAIDYLNGIGGIRVQSFSDFETPHMLDMMQAVMDMYAKGLKSQAYTKVVNFAWIFGGTGMKINLSLIGDGVGYETNPDGTPKLDKNGKMTLVFSNTEGMNFEEAMKVRNKYGKNVGTVLVGINDNHILAAMADDRIDFIIPFHKSGWSQDEFDRMTTLQGYQNYESWQNERVIVGKNADGTPKYKNVGSNIMPEEYWDFTPGVTGKQNAENYLRLCNERGIVPKFNNFLDVDENGNYHLKADGSTDGYWKLLIDFKMFDNEGNPAKQQTVTPEFNMEHAMKTLDAYEGNLATLPVADDVVQEYVKWFKDSHPLKEGQKYSLPDENMNVRQWMMGLSEGSLQTENEKQLLQAFKDLQMKISVANMRKEEYSRKLRQLEAKAQLTPEERREKAELENRIAVNDEKLQRLEQQLFDVTDSEGYAGMMYTYNKFLQENVYGRTQGQIEETAAQMAAEARRARQDIEKRERTLAALADTEEVRAAKNILAQTGLTKFTSMLRTQFNTSMGQTELSGRLAEISLKMLKGENTESDLQALADEIVNRQVGFGAPEAEEQLSRLRGMTITIGPGEKAELRAMHETIQSLRDRIKGSGIKLEYGPTSTLDTDVQELLEIAPGLEGQLDNDKDALPNFVGYVESLLGQLQGGNELGLDVDEVALTLKSFANLMIYGTSNDQQQAQALLAKIEQAGTKTQEQLQALQQLKDTAARMEAAGVKVKGWASILQKDMQHALDYFNQTARQAAEVERQRVRESVINNLKAENTRKLVEQEQKFKERMKNDREARDLYESNQVLRRKAATVIKRLGSQLMHETDLKHLPEETKPLARYLVNMIVRHDSLGGRQIAFFPKSERMKMLELLNGLDMRDGKPNMDRDLDWLVQYDSQGQPDYYVQDAVLESLMKIERAIIDYDRSEGQGNISLRDRNAALTAIQENLSRVMNIIKNTQEVEIQGRKELTIDVANDMVSDMDRSRHKGQWSGAVGKQIEKVISAVGYGNTTPEYFIKNLRNATMSSVYEGFHKSENDYGLGMRKVKQFMEDTAERFHFGTWDQNKKLEFRLSSGRTLYMTPGQLMSLYATWKREESAGPENSNHLKVGGFHVYEEGENQPKIAGRIREPQRAHRMTDADFATVCDLLTEEQKEYADTVVAFMSDDMSKLGNEASMKMYGIKKYLEKYYFPMASWGGVLNKRSDAGINAQSDNRGAHQTFTKRRVRNANNALEISDFTATAAKHMEGMMRYATTAVAIENMNRIMNQQLTQTYGDESAEGEQDTFKRNVRAAFTAAYGKNAMDYFDTFMKDLNGGIGRDNRKTIKETLLSVFKKNAVAGSGSVALQQPLSYIRAAMMIDPKYLAQAVNPKYWKGSYEEMMAHSGVAVIKDMGKFDMGYGQSGQDYLTPEGKKGKLQAAYDWLSEKSTALPEKMDKMTWTRMWSACKLEMAAQHPEMDTGSDEFLDLVGVRFNDLMRKTQVYDSTFVKSANMRSNNYAMKVLTSFRAEPTLTANVLADAYLNRKEKGGTKNVMKALGTFIIGAVAQAAAKGMFGAGRKPDDDKNRTENFIKRFIYNFFDEINPLNLIPGYSDMMTALNDGEVKDNAMGVINTLNNSVKTLVEAFEGKETNVWQTVEDTIGQLVQVATNIPAKNIMRDTRAMLNFFSNGQLESLTGGTYAQKPTDWGTMKYMALDELMGQDMIGWLNGMLGDAGYQSDNKAYYRRLYEAEQRGDTEEAENIRSYLLGKGVKETTITQNVNSIAKKDENASPTEKAQRIVQSSTPTAATKYVLDQVRGSQLTAEEARSLIKQANPDKDDDAIWWQVDRVEYTRDKDLAETVDGKYYRLYDAIENNSSAEIGETVKTMMKHGVTKDQIKQQIKDRYKSEYLNATGKEKIRLKDAMIKAYKAVGMSAQEAEDLINSWKPAKK